MPDSSKLADALLRPASVALVGASGSADKTSGRPMQYLQRAGWHGDVYPVNPARESVQGKQAWPSVRALPAVPDHAFILTGSDDAVEAARECAEAGIPVVSIMADGFVGPEGSLAARRADALREIASNTATRILGPSSLGVVNLHEDLTLTANAAFAEPDLPRGGVFVASHSGGMIGALVSRGKQMGIGFAGLVSTGGEIDLSSGEICQATLDDPQVRSYALFLESFAGIADLREFAIGAAERNKPVLAYKLGRSEAGANLSLLHTGALAGDDVVASALLSDLGIGRVTTFEALLEGQHLARRVPVLEHPVPQPRVGVITTTGGGGAMVIDCLAVRGAIVEGPSSHTRQRLHELGIDSGHGALVDLTLAGAQYEVVKTALDVLLSAPEFDAVVAVPGSSARFQPDLAVRPIADSAGADKPLAAFVMPDAPEALRLLRESGVAAFRTPEACADALVTAFSRRRPRTDTTGPPPTENGSALLDEADSYQVLEQLGVKHAPYHVLNVDESVDELPLPGPVAVKALAAGLAHKSDVGGVVLGVTDVTGLRAAMAAIPDELDRRGGPRTDHVLVQAMVHGLGEALIGYRYDPQAGPIVLLAAGGLLAEIHQDRSVRTAPVTIETAREMIDEVLSFQALNGYRGSPRGDLEALAHAVVALSNAATAMDGSVLEAEANPVIVLPDGEGVVAVDALVQLAGSESRP